MANASNNIQPLGNYVLVKPGEEEKRTVSGIILPDTATKKSEIGEIMAVGPGGIDDQGNKTPMTLKVGQKVLYKKWGGNEVKVQNEEWLLMEQKDVMAIVM